MRILQVNLEDEGGAFALVYQIQKALNNKIVFDYYSMGSFKRQEVINSIYNMKGEIIEANLRKNRFVGHLLLPFRFYRFLKENNYAAIHVHSDTAWKLLIYAMPAKIAGIRKVIVHSHSSYVNGDHLKLKLFFHIIARNLLPKYVDIYCACSDKAALWMFPSKVQEKVLYIKNGIDVEKYAFNIDVRKKIRSKLDITEDEFVIGTIGNFSYQKNPEFMIEVFKELFKRDQRIKLIFVGDGDRRNDIQALIKRKEYEQNIMLLGYTKRVSDVVNVMDCFVLPSRFEGFPVSGVEAQANGLPCVFSDAISKQCAIADNCSFISLDEKPSKWADKIISYKGINLNRNIAAAYVKAKGFTTQTTADFVYKIYV